MATIPNAPKKKKMSYYGPRLNDSAREEKFVEWLKMLSNRGFSEKYLGLHVFGSSRASPNYWKHNPKSIPAVMFGKLQAFVERVERGDTNLPSTIQTMVEVIDIGTSINANGEGKSIEIPAEEIQDQSSMALMRMLKEAGIDLPANIPSYGGAFEHLGRLDALCTLAEREIEVMRGKVDPDWHVSLTKLRARLIEIRMSAAPFVRGKRE